MKGGSKASDLVMATNPKLCDGKVSPVITGHKFKEMYQILNYIEQLEEVKNIKRKNSRKE